jgi:hypothetical protein
LEYKPRLKFGMAGSCPTHFSLLVLCIRINVVYKNI